VVGVPGDVLELRANRLIVNGEPVTYAPLAPELLASRVEMPADRLLASEDLGGALHPVMITPRVMSRCSFAPVTLPPGAYFVMGDNRDESFDSRYFGFVERERILGRALAVAASVDPGHHFMPRWDRFCRGLR
jgi:signal peptidase I